MRVYVYVREHDNAWTVHSIEIKFGMYIIGKIYNIHTSYIPRKKIIEFEAAKMYSVSFVFLQEYKKEIFYMTTYGLKLFSIGLKFKICIILHTTILHIALILVN